MMCSVFVGNGSKPETYLRPGFPDIISSNLKVHYRAPTRPATVRVCQHFSVVITQTLSGENLCGLKSGIQSLRLGANCFNKLKCKIDYYYMWSRF